MNKTKLFFAFAFVAISTLTACGEKTQTPEQVQFAKQQAIEKEIQSLEIEYDSLNKRDRAINGGFPMLTKETGEKKNKLDSLKRENANAGYEEWRKKVNDSIRKTRMK